MENNNESAIYELRLSLYDMIRVAKGVIENRGTILTARKRVEAAEGILKKHFKITDILRHQQPQPGPRWVKASIDNLPLHKAFWNIEDGFKKDNSFPVRIDGRKYGMGDIYDDRKEGAPDPIYYFVINGEDYYENNFHRIEWLDEQPVAGREEDIAEQDRKDGKELSAHYAHIEACEKREAVAFVNWTLSSGCDTYTCTDEDQWTNIHTQENITTAELYDIFKKENP